MGPQRIPNQFLLDNGKNKTRDVYSTDEMWADGGVKVCVREGWKEKKRVHSGGEFGNWLAPNNSLNSS